VAELLSCDRFIGPIYRVVMRTFWTPGLGIASINYSGMGRKSEFVFYNQKTGKPFIDLSAGLQLACKKAGITGVTWHTLRHTFASRLLERGADIMTVKELLGHSTVIVTMRYTHSNLDSKVAAVGKLAGNCYNPATPCTTMQQSSPKVSQIRR
jgi:integrase